MTPADIGWTISFVFWLIFIITAFISNRRNDPVTAMLFNMMQFVCLGFLWLFEGFSRGWW